MRIALYVALSLPALTPLFCLYPPFQDWAGHAGVIGLIHHYPDPATRVAQFFLPRGFGGLNALTYWLGAHAAVVIGPLAAANLILALALGSLGPALARLCAAVDADERLAFAALPLAFGRHVYCGFIPNAGALSIGLLVFAAYFRHRKTNSSKSATLVVGWLLLLAATHAFIFLAIAGLLLIVVLWDLIGAWRASLVGAGGLLGSGSLFAMLYSRGVGYIGAKYQKGEVWAAIWDAIDNPKESPETFLGWLFAFHPRTELDDYAQWAWLGLIGFGVLAAFWVTRKRWSRAQMQLLVVALVTLGMFFILPVEIGKPVNWWAASLRLPPMILLFCIPLCGALGGWWRVHRALIAVICVGFMAGAWWDLAKWQREDIEGFPEIIDVIPPGKRISMLYYSGGRRHPGIPLIYFSQYYLVQKGGIVGHTFSTRYELPFKRRAGTPQAGSGSVRKFRPAHLNAWDGFIVERARNGHYRPFHGPLKNRVRLVAEAGRFRYYVPLPPAPKPQPAVLPATQPVEAKGTK